MYGRDIFSGHFFLVQIGKTGKNLKEDFIKKEGKKGKKEEKRKE